MSELHFSLKAITIGRLTGHLSNNPALQEVLLSKQDNLKIDEDNFLFNQILK